MKVLCITEVTILPGHEDVPNPQVGDVDTVIGDGWDEDLKDYYLLQRFGVRYGYSQIHFAQLSSICETEMIRNYNTQNV
jgi:hypothetical protein